jgi:DNA polymerase-3 subunit epsilon
LDEVSRLGLSGSRRLDWVCVDLGIEPPDSHCALADARATSGLLSRVLDDLDWTPAVVPHLTNAPVPPPSLLRTDPPPPRLDTSLGTIADRVGVPDGLDVSDDSASAYLALLDRVLEDRKITDQEVSALAAVAAEWGIGSGAVRSLHAAYLAGVQNLARADEVITDAEAHDLAILAEWLGVSLDEPARPSSVRVGHTEDLRGKSVCFTGASIVSIQGLHLERADQERIAAKAGLVIKTSVSKKCDILVLADPDSRSGKSKVADDLGVRKIAEPVFWRMLGVPID